MANARCQSCHAVMNPSGFAFENFDGIGVWRDAEGETPVDAQEVLKTPDTRQQIGARAS